MKSHLFIITVLLAAMTACTARTGVAETPVPNIIFDTDIGNDIDDAEALDLLYKYVDEGKINLLGICLNKSGFETARFVDIMGCWYGHPEIPFGVIRTDKPTGAPSEQCYSGRVCQMTADDGSPLFEYSKDNYEDLPDSYKLYRKLLSEAADKSVTIVSVGFFNNLALLLDSPADEISPLTGRELVGSKVKLLSIMAGRFFDENPEFNVMVDIPASQKIFSEWPTEMAILTWELGMKVHYPASSIENDFSWTEAHPLKEAYIRYGNMPYDNTMFDPTAVVYGAGETGRFTIGEPGDIDVDDTGVTRFTASESGRARIMYLSDEQASDLLEYFKDYLTRRPACKQ